jgi:hypothetical protein
MKNSSFRVCTYMNGEYSDSLQSTKSGNLMQVQARFSTPDQTGRVAKPAPYTMDTGSFPGVRRPERDLNHHLLSSVEVKERAAFMPDYRMEFIYIYAVYL